MDKKINKNRERRMEIINQIFNTIISKKGDKINYKKFISLISLDKGISIRTAKEYIDVLVGAEKIKLNDGELYFESSEEILKWRRMEELNNF